MAEKTRAPKLQSEPVVPGSGVHPLLVDGQLLLYGDVGDVWGDGTGFSAAAVVAALSAAKPGPLLVRINSGGGVVTEGFAIYNALKARGNINVQIDGIAASAASLIAMAGTERVMRGASIMMIHDPSGITWGTVADHEETIALLNSLATICAGIYASVSGKTAEEARAIMTAETWFGPQAAVDEGFATSIDDTSADETMVFSAFDYMLYENAPEKVRAANRSLPEGVAAIAARMETTNMNELELAAKKAADKLIADATAEAAAIVTKAKDGTAAEAAEAKVKSDQLVADATKTAAQIVADAKTKVDATASIVARCEAAGLDIKAALDIVTKSKGDVNAAKDLIIDAVAGPAKDRVALPANVTSDASERFVLGATKGLLFRAGQKGGERNEFSGLTLRELAREALRMRGVNRVFSDPMEMVREAFRPNESRSITMSGPGYHSTSDFSEILANVANKSLLKGFEEAEETFPLFTSVGNLVDFKATRRVDLNLFPALAEVPEGGEYTYGTIGERGATVQLATYGKMFAITRQAIINDDMNAFTRIPQKMGRAARRTIGNLVFAQLTLDTNPMADGFNLWDATNHHNYTASGAAPNATTFQTGLTGMKLQKDPDNIAVGGLNIRPKFFLVPVELEAIARILMTSVNDPSATTPNVINPVNGLATIISDARLSAKSAKEWYLMADPNQFDVIEVAYLNGNQTPTLEQKDGWDVDGTSFKVRIDAAVTVLDYRGLYKNNGE